jgi:hypothetical protein
MYRYVVGFCKRCIHHSLVVVSRDKYNFPCCSKVMMVILLLCNYFFLAVDILGTGPQYIIQRLILQNSFFFLVCITLVLDAHGSSIISIFFQFSYNCLSFVQNSV